jgi:hypothetical protein
MDSGYSYPMFIPGMYQQITSSPRSINCATRPHGNSKQNPRLSRCPGIVTASEQINEKGLV